jgi:hypothetical protein
MLWVMRATEPGYSGMTVNERLIASGLLSAWDSAIRNGERQVAIDLLSQVDLIGQAAEIVDTVFGDPAKYGFPPSH